jgi:predicted DNA-binding protein (MmcQ/YjbR family)
MRTHQNVDSSTLERLRSICLVLPEAKEERAWVGTRWKISAKTFAHALPIADGWPPAYVKASGSEGPLTVLTFRAEPAEHEALRRFGDPFFAPTWWPDIIGMVITAHTDWEEVAELVTESYRLFAPKRAITRLV